jgi:hypothetical protein
MPGTSCDDEMDSVAPSIDSVDEPGNEES